MDKINLDLDLFSPKEAELKKLVVDYKNLTINGIDDKEGFEKVHKAQMILRDHRTGISKTRLEHTRQLDDAKKKIMDKEKELIGIISPIEEDLKNKKQAILDEKERIKKEKERKKQEILDNKMKALVKYGVMISSFDLELMDDTQYDEFLEKAKNHFEEQERLRIDKEKEEEEERKEQEILKVQNAVNSMILNAKDGFDLNSVKSFIEDHKLNFKDFEKDWNAKKEMIASQEKLEEDKRKVEEDKQKLKEKEDKIENKKLEAERKVEEDKRVEKARKQAKKEEKEKAKKKEEDRIKKEEKEKKEELERKKAEQEKIEKNKNYKEFIEKCGINNENENEFKIVPNHEEKTVTVYKKVDTFKF